MQIGQNRLIGLCIRYSGAFGDLQQIGMGKVVIIIIASSIVGFVK